MRLLNIANLSTLETRIYGSHARHIGFQHGVDVFIRLIKIERRGHKQQMPSVTWPFRFQTNQSLTTGNAQETIIVFLFVLFAVAGISITNSVMIPFHKTVTKRFKKNTFTW